jgi:hypothetical protein
MTTQLQYFLILLNFPHGILKNRKYRAVRKKAEPSGYMSV